MKFTLTKRDYGWIIISFFIVLILIFLYTYNILLPIENIFYDLRFKLRGPIKTSNNIIIVKIDEASISALGRWPWDRKIMAKAVESLYNAGAKIVALDILYPEKSNKISDSFLKKSLSKGNSIIASHFESVYENILKNGIVQKMAVEKIIYPIDDFAKVSKVGFTNIEPDDDGVVRKVKIWREFEGERYYSFSYLIASEYLAKSTEKNLKTIPSNIYINFYGPSEYFSKTENKIESTFVGYSFIDIYKNIIPHIWLKDKIIMIGATSTGSYDHYPIPYIKTYPGVELNATVVENLITKTYLKKILDKKQNVILLITTSSFLSVLLYITSPFVNIIIIILFLTLYFFVTYFLFLKLFYIIEFTHIGITFLFFGFSCIFYKLIFEQKEKKSIKKTFSKYINPYIMEELLQNPKGSLSGLGGQKKEITVVFTDIRSFTTISEKLPAEEVVSFLNKYFQIMNEIIFKYNGTIDKYIGDCIMFFWNAPLAQPDHAYLAVKCVMEMFSELEKLNEKEELLKNFKIKIGAGINTGEAVVGNIGSTHLMEYTAVGDTVNTASRLQSLTKDYNAPIIISEFVQNKLENRIPTKSLGKIKIRGKEKEIEIFKVGNYVYNQPF